MTTNSSTKNASFAAGQKVTILRDDLERVAAIFLTPTHLQYKYIDSLIAFAEGMPTDFVLLFCVDGYEEDQRGIWKIPEVRDFLRRVLLRAPQILRRFSVEQRHLFRLCFRDVSHVHVDGATRKSTIYYAMDPRWQDIASASGLDPEVLA